ncbi:uncharacterized protein [Euphorbia lathyris]|uniref:uncharacterized protein n=1 Tax=Euphorbia lathyris TaxID=212925 RepID=UPI0033141F15
MPSAHHAYDSTPANSQLRSQNSSLHTAINSSSLTRRPINQNLAMLICFLLLYLTDIPGTLSSAVVTLDSIKIYNTHEWLKTSKPDVYFSCKGENKTFLPDVKEVNVSYTFNGEESWQPLTENASKKCKRCGFYEKDTFKPDDVYDEWEFCPSAFEDSNGKYVRHKKNEFDATFLCPMCLSLAADLNSGASLPQKGNGMHIFLVILICVVVSTVLVLGVILLHKYWQKKKREQDQARFLKLFEDEDGIEDELGLDLEM